MTISVALGFDDTKQRVTWQRPASVGAAGVQWFGSYEDAAGAVVSGVLRERGRQAAACSIQSRYSRQ